jgi:hypothetical protein
MKTKYSGRAAQGILRAGVSVWAWGKTRTVGLATMLCVSLAIAGGAWLIGARGASAIPRPQAGGGTSPTYTFTTIAVPGEGKFALQGTFAIANNAGGDVAGVYVDNSYAAHGFVRAAATGTISKFDAPNAGTTKNQGTFPIRIEIGGNITGMYADSSNAYHGFLRTPEGTITEFDVTGAPTTIGHRGTIPLNINAALQITGFYVDANAVRHGFIRAADGTFTTFDFPGAGTGPTQGTMPMKINGPGGVTGFYVDANQVFHGFLRNAKGGFSPPIDAPNASGGQGAGKGIIFAGTIAHSVDGLGDFAGIYTDSNFVFHGFLLSANSVFTSIDVPGASTTGVFRGTLLTNMDGFGDVTGAYSDASGVEHGFTIVGGTTTINAPLDVPGASTTGLFAGTVPLSINGTGELAGTYADASGIFQGFIATASAVANPTFSPAPGTYSSAQSVTLSDTTPNSGIFYTTDGTSPATSATAIQYTGPIAVSSTETIEAIAGASGFANSAVVTATYTINSTMPAAATPTFSPATGTYTSAQTVTISDTTAGATIYYTLDGSTPSTGSTKYTGTISVGSTETIKAIAAATGFSNSAVATATYTINLGDFQVSVNPTTLTIVAGQSGTATFTVTPENGFNSSVSFACSGLPSEASCTFSPSSVTPSGQPVTTTLTVTTTAPSAAGLAPLPFFQRPIYAMLLPVLAMAWGIRARRRGTLGGAKLLCLLLLLLAGSGLASCNGGSTSVKNPGTPVGTSTASVSAATSGAAVSHSATLKIIITK